MHTCPIAGHRDAEGVLQPVMIDGALCDWHAHRVEINLRELPRYYVRLALAMAPGSAAPGDRVSTSRTPPLPINVLVRSLQEDVCRLVRTAEIEYRLFRGWPRSRYIGRESERLALGVLFLIRQWEPLLNETPGGVDVALGIWAIVGSIRRTLALDKLIHRLPAPCPECDCMALERESGASVVRCRHCGLTFTEADYARLVLVLASS